MLLEELVQWPAMVKGEDVVGACNLLDEESGRADFSRRVLDGWLGIAGVFGGARGGELGEVDGLDSSVQSFGAAVG
jgi:hypothetical protein